MSLKKLVVTAFAALTLVACGTSSVSEQSHGKNENTIVKIGVSGTNHPQWDYIKVQLKEKENINLEIVEFEDYVTPNTALEDGSIDLNAFQHILYLNKFNAEKGTHIKPIAYTMYSPMGVYSQKVKALDELKNGDKISIPNDTTNGARALRLLHHAGVIKLNDVSNVLVTVSDIVENPKKLEIIELVAGQTYQSLPDVAVAVINANYAVDAGLTPKTDAIYLEEVNEASKPYYNVIAAREDRVKEEVFQTIIKYYQTPEVTEISKREFRGANLEIWDKATLDE